MVILCCRCEWKSEKDDFPQQCRFNLTSKEDNWSIELESADETGEIRTLSKSTQKLNLQITCRTANELRFKVCYPRVYSICLIPVRKDRK